MKYESFEEGLRAIASHETGDHAFFGPLEVGVTNAQGEHQPYVKLANHTLHLSDAEAATIKHITIDFERFPRAVGKETTRVEFIKHGHDWKIIQSGPVASTLLQDPRYTHRAALQGTEDLFGAPSENQPHADTVFALGNWRVDKLTIVKDNNSIGTVLNGERAYCGKEGIRNVAFLHQPVPRARK